MERGVYNIKLIVDLTDLPKYLEQLLAEFQESRDKKRRIGPGSVFQSRLDRLNEALKELKDEMESYFTILGEGKYFEILPRILAEFAAYCECPEEMKNVFSAERRIGSDRVIRRIRPKPIFGSRILIEAKDVICVERTNLQGARWLFDVTTLKDSGLSVFKKDISSIPAVAKHMSIIKEGRQFSSRYTFRPYPLVAKLWLGDEASLCLPSDVKSFLVGAINYISSQEWRTSIVLSAIAVESVLADMYEEVYKTSAPDSPLGDLFQQVRKQIDFPAEIVSAIEATNRARIASVHRTRQPVSDREAINALYGAVVFTQHTYSPS